MNDRQRIGGFTLIELMVAVAIIGILSAVAVPSFIEYIRKSKTTEARIHLRKIYEGANVYYLEGYEGTGEGLEVKSSQFPAPETPTPAVSCCTAGGERCAPDPAIWKTPTWKALKFSMPDPHYYQYEFGSSGTGADAEFTAFAYGDLDCDTDFSTFRMWGVVHETGGDPTLSSGTSRHRELE